MQNLSTRRGLGLAMSLCVVAISGALGLSAAGAQDNPAAVAAVKPQKPANSQNQKGRGQYYVDFRSRTAASYGHAFVWYGRVGERQVEVAGLHPATDSVIPYIVGHVLPVVSETGASYGDLDEQYLTASFRVMMDEPEGQRAHAYIKRLQATSPFWNAATYNCVAFIQDIARHIGLRVPGNHLLYPEDWVNNLRKLNGGGKVARLPSSGQAPSGMASVFPWAAQGSAGQAARTPAAGQAARARRAGQPSAAAEARGLPAGTYAAVH